jgi:thioredoxin 1
MSAKIFNDENFQEEVLNSSKLTVVDFWAPWCGPCQMVVPIIEELAKEYSEEVKIGKMNVDENRETPMNYGVMGIPNIAFFKNGEKVGEIVGANPKEVIKAKIEELR